MSARSALLAGRIRSELAELGSVVGRVEAGWRRYQVSRDEIFLDSVALNLHGFYSGLERVFELIATGLDASMPGGANWHLLLLEQMAHERTGIRPAVLSDRTRGALDPYRGFRHVVRNVYTFQFDPARMELLVAAAPTLFAEVRAELLAFAHFIENAG